MTHFLIKSIPSKEVHYLWWVSLPLKNLRSTVGEGIPPNGTLPKSPTCPPNLQICQHYNLCEQLHLCFISLKNSNMWIKLLGDSRSSQLLTENSYLCDCKDFLRPNMKTWSLYNKNCSVHKLKQRYWHVHNFIHSGYLLSQFLFWSFILHLAFYFFENLSCPILF